MMNIFANIILVWVLIVLGFCFYKLFKYTKEFEDSVVRYHKNRRGDDL